MENKSDFYLLAERVVSVVDFIKWTSSFGTGAIRQMEAPLTGIRLTTQVNEHFAIARDDIGWMIVAHEHEGGWMEHFPFAEAFIGFNDGIILTSEPFTALEQEYPSMGIELTIPDVDVRTDLGKSELVGFGLYRAESQTVERVNRIVPLLDRDRYAARRSEQMNSRGTRLFSQL